jgi:hypothetical protein
VNLAASVVVGSMLLGQASANLDFSQRTMDGWHGSGFSCKQIGNVTGAWSDDSVATSGKGELRYRFVVPLNSVRLTCKAYGVTADRSQPDGRLDVVVKGPDGRELRREMSHAHGLGPAPYLYPATRDGPREYSWDVSTLVGRIVEVSLLDNDDRPGSHVWAGGFKLLSTHHSLESDFARTMIELQNKHKLRTFYRFHSKRFMAISNAGESFSKDRLRNCENFIDQFLDHFEKKGFKVQAPAQRLMLAIFDNHDGFDAYFGQKMPAGIAGIYHTPTNRLVIYDLKENRAIAANRENVLRHGQRIDDIVERTKFLGAMERRFAEHSTGLNLSTTMHECAHLVSFNCGLLNRQGDAACWVVEGMATYCEAVEHGDWTALGGNNPMRLGDLVRVRGHYVPLRELVRGDSWRNTNQVLTGYAQCWALYHMLMNEEPARLQKYLALIRDRKTSDHRLTDFIEAFGDVTAMEERHYGYIQNLLKHHTASR